MLVPSGGKVKTGYKVVVPPNSGRVKFEVAKARPANIGTAVSNILAIGESRGVRAASLEYECKTTTECSGEGRTYLYTRTIVQDPEPRRRQDTDPC